MKRILTVALAMVMVLALAIPAMAFTGTSSAASALAPKLSIYLIDYSDAGFFGIASLPAADRGYAKNEVVAAVVELAVPKGMDSAAMNYYGQLTFSGTNASLNVADNTPAAVKTVGDPTPVFMLDTSANTLKRSNSPSDLTAVSADTTYKWLFFAKVTGDGAKLTVTLPDLFQAGSGFKEGEEGSAELGLALNGVTYVITRNFTAGVGGYYVIDIGTHSDYIHDSIRLYVDANHKTTGMAIATTTIPLTPLGVTVGGVLGYVNGSTVVTSSTDATYSALMAVYNDVVKGVFGLDYFKIGNYLYDSFFTGLTSPKTITASVDIKPYAPYVTVPSATVVTPPKTGDATGIMGFVMIVLAAAAAVAVKKVRA